LERIAYMNHGKELAVPEWEAVQLEPREHTALQWLPYAEAAALCFSPSNAEACLLLPRFAS
jgi:dATP pyrophosphohydrolase